MAAAEAVVASRSRDQETTTARNGGHSAVEQLALPLDGPSPADMARGVIPLAPRREKPDPVTAPTRQDNPSHDTDAPASGALWDPFPGKFTKIPSRSPATTPPSWVRPRPKSSKPCIT